MRRAQSHRRLGSGGSSEYEDNDNDIQLLTQQPVLNVQHYVGHSLVKQRHGTGPPTFRPLSRTGGTTKNFKPGLKQANSHGTTTKGNNDMTGMQKRAAELTGAPLINFNIKRSGRGGDSSSPEPEVCPRPEEFHVQHPPLYQHNQIQNMLVQQHLRFLSAYQHSGLLALRNQGVASPPNSMAQNQNRILRKNYSMCEDLLLETEMKQLWETSSEEFNVSSEDCSRLPPVERVNFRLGPTLSLPQMLMGRESEFSPAKQNEFQMDKEDEERFLPPDLLSDDGTTSTDTTDTENDQDSKSLPIYFDASLGNHKKQTLRKTMSLRVDRNNNDTSGQQLTDFSLFPQTSQSDLLGSLRSRLVKHSMENRQLEDFSEPIQTRKLTSSRHLERAIKSLSISTDVSRKF